MLGGGNNYYGGGGGPTGGNSGAGALGDMGFQSSGNNNKNYGFSVASKDEDMSYIGRYKI